MTGHGLVAGVRGAVERAHRWQPLMPRFWFAWLWDAPFALVCIGLVLFNRDDAFRLLMGFLLLGSVVVQARREAKRRVRQAPPDQ